LIKEAGEISINVTFSKGNKVKFRKRQQVDHFPISAFAVFEVKISL
jgi:hypothetical protein